MKEKGHEFSRLRIAMITPFPPMHEGVAEYTRALVQSLSRSDPKVLVRVLAPRGSTSFRLDLEKYSSSVVVRRFWRKNSLLDRLRILNDIKNFSADIVHFQYGPYSEYGGLLGEPFFPVFLFLKVRGIPSILTLHSLWLPEEAERRILEYKHGRLIAKLGARYYFNFIRIFLRLFDRILVCVNFRGGPVIKDLNKRFGIPLEKTEETVHGIYGDFRKLPNRTLAKKRLKLEGYRTILCFGYIRRGKGLEHAIRALKLLKEKEEENLIMVIAGKPNHPRDYDYLEGLRRLVAELDLNEIVRFDTRYLPKAVVETYYSSADVVVLPYDLRVGGASGPLALAVEFGVNIITTADRIISSTTLSSLIRLVPPKDPRSLAAAIHETISQSNLRDIASKVEPEDQHNFDKTAEEHIEIYKQIMERK